MKETSAGGFVYRIRDHQIEVLLIEDRFGYLTLPKGKKEPGETDQETALREVLEETGIQGEIVRKLQTIHYAYEHDQYGKVEKEVVYFLIRAIGGQEQPQLEEIRGVKWYNPADAYSLQEKYGYRDHQAIFDQAYELLQLTKKGGTL